MQHGKEMGIMWGATYDFGAYSNENVDSTDECVAKPDEAIDEVEQRKQEWHVLHTSGSDHHPLHTTKV
jgi:hypothetical protein